MNRVKCYYEIDLSNFGLKLQIGHLFGHPDTPIRPLLPEDGMSISVVSQKRHSSCSIHPVLIMDNSNEIAGMVMTVFCKCHCYNFAAFLCLIKRESPRYHAEPLQGQDDFLL